MRHLKNLKDHFQLLDLFVPTAVAIPALLLVIGCSTLKQMSENQMPATQDAANQATTKQAMSNQQAKDKNEPKVYASASSNPEEQNNISGIIMLEPSGENILPYRAFNYRVQLLNPLLNPLLTINNSENPGPENGNTNKTITGDTLVSEHRTNRNGEFVFSVEKDVRYYINIINNKNKVLGKGHGPFTAGDAITIKIPTEK